MAVAVYVLCALSSIACAVLLWRGARVSKLRLLFWSSLCFVFLAINSLLLLTDVLLVPGTDLTLLRLSTAVVGMSLLVFGLIWDAR
jgi:hypothetical protein